MKTKVNKLKKGVLILVAVMLLTIPNIPIYSAVGSYSTNSSTLLANSKHHLSSNSGPSVAWKLAIAAFAGAIILAYDSGYVIGTLAHHVYDSLDGHPKKRAVKPIYYSASDFSKFDN